MWSFRFRPLPSLEFCLAQLIRSSSHYRVCRYFLYVPRCSTELDKFCKALKLIGFLMKSNLPWFINTFFFFPLLLLLLWHGPVKCSRQKHFRKEKSKKVLWVFCLCNYWPSDTSPDSWNISPDIENLSRVNFTVTYHHADLVNCYVLLLFHSRNSMMHDACLSCDASYRPYRHACITWMWPWVISLSQMCVCECPCMIMIYNLSKWTPQPC